jgi:hypothetical protein
VAAGLDEQPAQPRGGQLHACVGIGSPPYANEHGGIEYGELPVEPVIIASDAAQARVGKTP